jgi:hypothetical protein
VVANKTIHIANSLTVICAMATETSGTTIGKGRFVVRSYGAATTTNLSTSKPEQDDPG